MFKRPTTDSGGSTTALTPGRPARWWRRWWTGLGVRPLILGPLCAVLGFMLLINFVQQRHHALVERASRLEETAQRVVEHVENDTRRTSAMMLTLIAAVRNDPHVEAAFRAGDREALLALVAPMFDSMREHMDISHLYFHLPDHTNLIRSHKPHYFGDLINRQTIREAHRTGAPSFGFEQGPLGQFTFRGVEPWFVDGELIGFLELGKEFEDVVAQLSLENHVEAIFLASKERLSRVRWELTAANLGRPSTWDDLPNTLVLSSTIRPIPAVLLESLSDPTFQVGKGMDVVRHDGRDVQCVFVPLTDLAGNQSAELVVLRDVTLMLRAEQNAAYTGIGLLLGAACLVVVAAYFVLGRVQHELDHRARRIDDAESHQATKELEIKRTRAEAFTAEQASRTKGEFLANMSHEIRTPMTAILGYADLLLDPNIAQSERTDAVQIIRRNGEHLLSIINDILDISKIEAGAMTVETIPCSPTQIVAEVESLMRVRAKGKGVELRVVDGAPLPRQIASDPLRLRQILLNLVGNAIKFTEKGEVVLEMRWKPGASANAPGEMVFEVRDTGIGMTPEQVRGLFTHFSQGDSSTARRFGGTGLGLTISRRMSDLLGGDITAISMPGEGSVFTLTIPTPAIRTEELVTGGLRHPIRRSQRHNPPPPTLNARVLLAEDGPDNQRLIAFHLRRTGATVQIAENGRIAVDKALAATEAGMPFDLVVMDMQMPEMDGYTAAATLRRNGHRGPILALTAHAMAGDRERCINAGCDDYQCKPIDPPVFLEACADLVAHSKSKSAA